MLIAGPEAIREYPMADRDPVEQGTDGPVTSIGDAAHPTYPVGSRGASQGVADARILGAEIWRHVAMPAALQAYQSGDCPRDDAVVLANRGPGPDAVMQMPEDRCGGTFDRIEDATDPAFLAAHAAHAARCKALAGSGIEEPNRQPPRSARARRPLSGRSGRRHTPCFSSRALCRSQSRLAEVSRLSASFLPRAIPSLSFTTPFALK